MLTYRTVRYAIIVVVPFIIYDELPHTLKGHAGMADIGVALRKHQPTGFPSVVHAGRACVWRQSQWEVTVWEAVEKESWIATADAYDLNPKVRGLGPMPTFCPERAQLWPHDGSAAGSPVGGCLVRLRHGCSVFEL